MKYPCILISVSEHDDRVMLAFNKNECQCINSERMSNYCGFDFDTSVNWKNITHEYLSNTYGKVESKEHAGFIKLLAETNDVVVFKDSEMIKAKGINYFSVTKDGVMYFWHDKSGIQYDRKKITIPMPPNNHAKLAINGDTTDLDSVLTFEADSIKLFDAMGSKVCEINSTSSVNDELLNNGDNLIFGGSDKCKEWPCVNDEVLICDEASLGRLSDLSGLTCSVIGICNNDLGDKILTLECEGLGVYAIADGPWIKKPKTPEQELRDDAIKDMSQSIRNKMPKINWDEAELIAADLYDFGYRKPQ